MGGADRRGGAWRWPGGVERVSLEPGRGIHKSIPLAVEFTSPSRAWGGAHSDLTATIRSPQEQLLAEMERMQMEIDQLRGRPPSSYSR